MTKLCYLALSWAFVIWTAISASADPTDTLPTEITLRIKDQDETKLIPLKKIDSKLANENVPVWTVRGDEPGVLIPSNEMMQAVGPVTFYQNRDFSAAAVYFHNLHKFYGNIDIRYVINGISLEDINNELQVQFFNVPGIMLRHPDLYGHRVPRSLENKDQQYSTNLFGIKEENLLTTNQSTIRLRRDLQDVHYVQTLLIVNYDLLNSINYGSCVHRAYVNQTKSSGTLICIMILDERNEFRSAIGIIHNLVVLFNSVDMLYSKLDELNIKINIAGIIIGTDLQSLPTYNICYKPHYVELRCINAATRTFLEKHSEVISPDSYNVPIFLTRNKVGMDWFFFKYQLEGLTHVPSCGLYDMRKLGCTMGATIGAHHVEYFGSFPVIAHEMAHAQRVKPHDNEPYMNEDNRCCSYLMKPHGKSCENCLTWSAETQSLLKEYYTSRDHCFHVEDPRSVKKPGPRKIRTADEQCQCYGYESAGTPTRTFLQRICRFPVGDTCTTHLACKDENGLLNEAPIPLDGTPCGKDADGVDKVCWFRKCVPVQKDEE